ncbi:lysine N(6)-hydroxylase/L-ornithine N(5)-oxygenase family protein [Enterovibrio paralichthyis]|uniref:lysine N(6)-hydroxylase/L-ornithine N(5)-oxygenase family protein n=1 Tax=Enterovibrio paralichthyis TaxID=2853805 RepID=UPI001C45818F|nr:SidA/IucD/PvdA family monooxygenase [Enterovibrio paralichthyis]MBV7299912.1 SidA/IucD/PvdA family monooxygenase [Enterovibrio paralichthyis]
MTTTSSQILDLAGIGAGPFNLSVAALLQQAPAISSRFFESRESVTWHPGMLLDDTHMQTMFLKDLVTPVSPQNPYSFLAYLVEKKRIYRFLSAELSCISRMEFSDYLRWASEKLPNIAFSTRVDKIEYAAGLFHIHTDKGTTLARNLCLGTGKSPLVPDCAKSHIGERVFHAAEIALRERDFAGKRVAIVGGGQSGADIFLNALRGTWGKPAKLDWVSRRPNYQPLDEAAFTNEYFTPDYVEAFLALSPEVKAREINNQKLTSDGITQKALLDIYRELYQRFDVNNEEKWVRLLPHRTMTQLHPSKGAYEFAVQNKLSEKSEWIDADIIVLATGFESRTPSCLDGLRPLINIDREGRFRLSPSFEVDWAHRDSNRIFAVNAGMHSHGIAEPQLSLMAWRSAQIVNRLCPKPVFDTDIGPSLMDWVNTSSKVEALA